KSTDLDVTALFSSPAVSAPVLEWQARYLQGVLIARELGPVEAFPALLEAARVVSTILSGLTKVEAEAFRKRHPDAASVFRELQKCAITDSTRQESERLIAASEWAVVDSQVPAHGSPPASV
ncbi:MAG TPA: hypothetical protein VGS41_00325, partial [Chthonomonadales bacterium]|nr:hypothetical protein [Chthonomonadales bacterium]